MTAPGWLAATLLAIALVAVPVLWDPALAQLDLLLLRPGALAFGGGLTLVPLLQHEVVDRLGWLTFRQFIDAIALGQVTPGPIVITATFVGYKLGGALGASVSTIAVFLPSFLVLVAAVPHYERIKRLRVVQCMIRGVLAAFIALLVLMLVEFARASLVDWKTWALAAWTALLWEVDLLLVVGGAAALSIVLF